MSSPLEELPAAALEDLPKTSARFYAYGALKLSGTQVSRSDLLPPDDSANYPQIGPPPLEELPEAVLELV